MSDACTPATCEITSARVHHWNLNNLPQSGMVVNIILSGTATDPVEVSITFTGSSHITNSWGLKDVQQQSQDPNVWSAKVLFYSETLNANSIGFVANPASQTEIIFDCGDSHLFELITPPTQSSPTLVPTGTTPSTQVPTGTNPPTQFPTGTNPPTQVPTGTTPPTQVPTGTTPPTQVPSQIPSPGCTVKQSDMCDFYIGSPDDAPSSVFCW